MGLLEQPGQKRVFSILLGMSASPAAPATEYGPARVPVASVVGRAVDIVAGTW
jgi:hypothetical protein